MMQQPTGNVDASSSDSMDGGVYLALSRLETRLMRVEEQLDELLSLHLMKDYYSTAEVAKLLNKAEFTVREWCRLGRVLAEKRACGRGQSQEWIIGKAELERIRSHGLLPTSGRPRTVTYSSKGAW